MTGVEIRAVLDGAPEFVADAVERLASGLGETGTRRSWLVPDHGRRWMPSPDDACGW